MKKLIILLFMCYIPVTSWGLSSFKVTEAEKKRLPDYCQVPFYQVPANHVASKVGYLNHYCYGLNFINRAQGEMHNSRDRKIYLVNAESEISAAISKNSKKHPFMPVMLNSLANVKTKQKKYDEAVGLYLEVIALKPKYTKAYGQLSNLYKRQGELEKALEAINEGLKHNPDSKYLKKKLKRLEKKLKK